MHIHFNSKNKYILLVEYIISTSINILLFLDSYIGMHMYYVHNEYNSYARIILACTSRPTLVVFIRIACLHTTYTMQSILYNRHVRCMHNKMSINMHTRLVEHNIMYSLEYAL